MQPFVLRQGLDDHLFEVTQNGEVIGRCDLLAAEEIAAKLEEQKFEVVWLYPEDSQIKRK